MPGYGVVGPTEGSGLLPWRWATDRLTDSHDYWLATVWPDHRPHVTPVWGVWRDDTLWFSCGRRSRKYRNLTANPAVTATADDPLNPVVVEGHAELLEDRPAIATYAGWADAKYHTNYGIDFYGDPANACFRIRVATVFGLSSDFTGSPTRWTF
jgi:PPOX class probable F420-dependent enzyme